MDTHDNIQDDDDAEVGPQHTFSKLTLAVLGAMTVVLALIGTDVAAIGSVERPAPRPVVQVVHMSGTPAVQPIVYLTASPGVKPGPDGKLHDAYSVTSFHVHEGRPVTLVINNTDSVDHSITAPAAGVNIIVRPGVHRYTLLVKKTGSFTWYCMYPCDPYSMSHDGYMRGTITSI